MDKEKAKAEKILFFRSQAQEYHFTREYNKAASFYIRAGLLGDLESIRTICLRMKNGYGMGYNFDEFFRCMQIGANAGIADAMYELGVCYSNGIGTEPDTKEAMHWFSEGAKAGSKEARRSFWSYNYDFIVRIMDDTQPFSYDIRKTVFVDEQGFTDEPDQDEHDADAKHFVMFDGSRAVATCRLYWDEAHATYILGRFAVLKEYRGIGVGSEIMDQVIAYVKSVKGKSVSLHAQLSAKAFYERFGFAAEGEPDEEQGQPHIWMHRRFPIYV